MKTLILLSLSTVLLASCGSTSKTSEYTELPSTVTTAEPLDISGTPREAEQDGDVATQTLSADEF